MRAALALCLAACSYSPAPNVLVDGAPDDTNTDGDPGAHCFGSSDKVCLVTLPDGPFDLNGGMNTITTDITTNCAPTTIESTITACVIAGTSIQIDGTLIGVGSRPLVLVATNGSIVVSGTLDVASHRDEMPGAGADPGVGCGGGTPPSGASGGAGGSLGGLGGIGGDGSGGSGGMPGPVIATSTLRGGCAGVRGGASPGVVGGGPSGGAVLLIANGIGIAGTGTINASGRGGDGGANLNDGVRRGGSGGGSGGMIVFDAPSLMIDGTVMAQGGAGGEGNDVNDIGDVGDDPSAAGVAAVGGSGCQGGNGGVGGTDDAGSKGTNASSDGGGGGGGGAGIIRVIGGASIPSTGTVVPAAS